MFMLEARPRDGSRRPKTPRRRGVLIPLVASPLEGDSATSGGVVGTFPCTGVIERSAVDREGPTSPDTVPSDLFSASLSDIVRHLRKCGPVASRRYGLLPALTVSVEIATFDSLAGLTTVSISGGLASDGPAPRHRE